jgi:hypothetical protein
MTVSNRDELRFVNLMIKMAKAQLRALEKHKKRLVDCVASTVEEISDEDEEERVPAHKRARRPSVSLPVQFLRPAPFCDD